MSQLLKRRRERKREIESRAEMTILVRTIIRSLLPIVLVFGIYIVSYGHLTPGGAFQGAMILIGAVMSFYLAFGYEFLRRFRDEELDLVHHVGGLIYLGIGVAGLATGAPFLSNIIRGGMPTTLLSGGIIPVLNFVAGFSVTAGTLIVLLILLEALRKGS